MAISKGKKAKLLPHEKELLATGCLRDVTHAAASARWLEAEPAEVPEGMTLAYRPMGDTELRFLLEHGQLPDSQPYQTVVANTICTSGGSVVRQDGRRYCEQYLGRWGRAKKVDTHPTTVVEFTVPQVLVNELFRRQHKPEEGVLSMGLGDKAGRGLQLFNAALLDSGQRWRIVTVKRSAYG